MIIDRHTQACGAYYSGESIKKYLDLHEIGMVVIMKKKLKFILLTMITVMLLRDANQLKIIKQSYQ